MKKTEMNFKNSFIIGVLSLIIISSIWQINKNIAVMNGSNLAQVLNSRPLTPNGLSGKPGLCGGNIDLSWNSVAGALGYRIYRTQGDLKLPVTGPTTNTSYVDTGLSVNTNYDYQVRATNNFGESEWSPRVTIRSSDICPPPTLSISASPTSVVAGTPSTLTWSTTNATSCTASGAWSGTQNTSGTLSVSPSVTSTYTLSCAGAGGNISTSQEITVNTTPTPNPPSSSKFKIGDSIKTTTNNANVRDSAGGNILGKQPINSSGKVVGGPANSSSGITFWNVDFNQSPDGWFAERYLVLEQNTNPLPSSPTVTISASPTSVVAGTPSTLTWSTTNATSCTASGGWTGTKATQGTQTVSPTANTTYTLTCTGAGGSANKSATISVITTPPPATGSNITPSNLLATLGVITGKPANQLQAMTTYDNRFNLYEKKHFDQYLIDYQINNSVASAFNHYGFLRSRLGYAMRHGEPYGPGITDENQYKYARGRRVVLDYLQKYSKPNNYAVATWLDTGLDDIEILYRLEGTPEALQHIHVRAAGATNDPFGYMKLLAPSTDARTVSLGLQSMMSAHRIGIPFAKPTNYGGGFDGSQGSWAASAKRNIDWLTLYGGVKSDGSVPSPAHGGPEAFFMNAMLVNQLLSYYAQIDRDPEVFNLAKLMIDHWITFLSNTTWTSLPYLSTDKGQAPDLEMFYVYPALVMWQETGDQKYYTFAMGNLARNNSVGYIQGYKQWNQAFSTGGQNIEALVAGVAWKPTTPPFPISKAAQMDLSASSNSIALGKQVKIVWTSIGMSSCTASGGWSGAQSTKGVVTLYPTASASYTLSCTGASGTMSKTIKVNVI